MGALVGGVARKSPVISGALLFSFTTRQSVLAEFLNYDSRHVRAGAGGGGRHSHLASKADLCNGASRSSRSGTSIQNDPVHSETRRLPAHAWRPPTNQRDSREEQH